MASESGKFKEGDWVRAKADWCDVVKGGTYRVDEVSETGVWVLVSGDPHHYMRADEIEPWTPDVGDRVRVTGNEAWAGVGEVYDLVGGVVFVNMLDGRRAGCEGGFPLREVEPVVDGAAEKAPAAPANDNTKPTGTLVKTRQGYGFEVARHGNYAWVDMGQKAPVTLRVEDITAA